MPSIRNEAIAECNICSLIEDFTVSFFFFVFILQIYQKFFVFANCPMLAANGTRLCEVRIFEICPPGCDDDLKTDDYSVPLGIGIGQVIKEGKTVYNVFAEPQFSVADDGPRHRPMQADNRHCRLPQHRPAQPRPTARSNG